MARYMELCLAHPRLGYYSGAPAIGRGGDFITAPEISQVFGELIGFFVVNLWQQMGEPPSFTLLELGPGRGVLIEDALRAAGRAEGFLDALHLQLFESNVLLRDEQRRRLEPYHPYWAPEIDTVSDDPLIVIANEFFDALPIRQFIRMDDGWHERLVGLRDNRLAFGLSPVPLADAPFNERDVGAVREVSPARLLAMSRLCQRIAIQGGAILVVDYGYETPMAGETLQAVRDHAFAQPLDAPGETDVSAHVDFAALREAATAAGLGAAPLANQGDFLRRLGAVERADVLARANPAAAASVTAGIERLLSPDQMGTLFKVLCAHSPGLEPAGFA